MAGRKDVIAGLPELNRALAKLPKRIVEAADRATRAETEAARDDMRRGAPRDTGKLADSVQSEYDISTHTGTAAATADYADDVEYGTSDTRAQPFVMPAAERSRQRFPKRLRKEVDAALRERA